MIAELQLAEAKKNFFTSLLDDELLGRLILDALDVHTGGELVKLSMSSGFTAEPWRPPTQVGAGQVLGLRFTRNALALVDGLDETMLDFTTYGYLKVAVTERVEREGEEFLLVGGDRELFVYASSDVLEVEKDRIVLRQSLAHFMCAWQMLLQEAAVLGAVIHEGIVVTRESLAEIGDINIG